MDIVNPLAEHYAEKFSSSEDELLKGVASFTMQQHPKAHMLSGHIQGALLTMISQMLQPLRILEIGTFTGYSALCLAKGLKEDGFIHTVEIREEDARKAKAFFERSVTKEKIILHIGDALKIIGELDEIWDLVFIDADKENYVNYFNLVLPKLRPKGFILADNVLFHGQVLEKELKGKNAKAIQQFNEYLLQRNDVEKLLLPVRDGLMIIRKC
ncbi:MAG: O-methyltransferase [Flavisolibacter sp.]